MTCTRVTYLLLAGTLLLALNCLPPQAFGQNLVQIPLLPIADAAIPEAPQPQIKPCTGWIWRTGLDCQPGQKRQNLLEPGQKPHKTIDNRFLLFAGISGAAAFADGYLSTHRIKASNNCYEVNPFLGKRPTAVATYSMTMGTWAGTNLLSYWLKRKHIGSTVEHDSVVWSMPQTIETIVHVIGIGMTVNNCKAPR